jgi:hypothetical protein
MHSIRAVVILAPCVAVACGGRVTGAELSDAGGPEDAAPPMYVQPIPEDTGVSPGSPDGGPSSSSSGGGPICVPKTCLALGDPCGSNTDGCGGVVHCGNCTPPDYCGGGGNNRCGRAGPVAVDSGGCVRATCQTAAANCGAIGDGCGGVVQCGTCVPPEYCGGGGFSRCGGTGPAPVDSGGCVYTTCQAVGASCGTIGDGCGGVIQCGDCVPPQFCGGGGYGQCGGPGPGPTDSGPIICIPTTCASLGVTCGAYGDGCGGLVYCGPCATDASADGPG